MMSDLRRELSIICCPTHLKLHLFWFSGLIQWHLNLACSVFEKFYFSSCFCRDYLTTWPKIYWSFSKSRHLMSLHVVCTQVKHCSFAYSSHIVMMQSQSPPLSVQPAEAGLWKGLCAVQSLSWTQTNLGPAPKPPGPPLRGRRTNLQSGRPGKEGHRIEKWKGGGVLAWSSKTSIYRSQALTPHSCKSPGM